MLGKLGGIRLVESDDVLQWRECELSRRPRRRECEKRVQISRVWSWMAVANVVRESERHDRFAPARRPSCS